MRIVRIYSESSDSMLTVSVIKKFPTELFMYLVCFNVSSIVSTNFTGSENPLSKVIEICISHSNQSDELIQLVNHYQVKFNPERR